LRPRCRGRTERRGTAHGCRGTDPATNQPGTLLTTAAATRRITLTLPTLLSEDKTKLKATIQPYPAGFRLK